MHDNIFSIIKLELLLKISLKSKPMVESPTSDKYLYKPCSPVPFKFFIDSLRLPLVIDIPSPLLLNFHSRRSPFK